MILAGWRTPDGGHVFFHTVERVSATHINFGVCNSGDGLNYHPTSLEKYPKVTSPAVLWHVSEFLDV